MDGTGVCQSQAGTWWRSRLIRCLPIDCLPTASPAFAALGARHASVRMEHCRRENDSGPDATIVVAQPSGDLSSQTILNPEILNEVIPATFISPRLCKPTCRQSGATFSAPWRTLSPLECRPPKLGAGRSHQPLAVADGRSRRAQDKADDDCDLPVEGQLKPMKTANRKGGFDCLHTPGDFCDATAIPKSEVQMLEDTYLGKIFACVALMAMKSNLACSCSLISCMS